MIAGRREKHLRLVLQASERLAVDDPVAVALERRPNRIFGFGPHAATAVGALCRLGRKDLALALFQLLSEGHSGVITVRRSSLITISSTMNTMGSQVCLHRDHRVIVSIVAAVGAHGDKFTG